MNTAMRILPVIAGVVFALAAHAAETEEPRLEEAAQPSRWRISAGARFAPGVKTKASISSRAVLDAARHLRGAQGASTSTERRSSTSADETSENVPVTPTSRFEFDGGFIDMDDTTQSGEETWYWHFDSADVFDEATGSITISSSAGEGAGTKENSSSASRSSSSEQIMPDVASSDEADLWGGDIEIGYDLWQDGRLSLGLGLGATFYRGEDTIRVAGRCGRATSATSSASTSQSSTETTVITDPNFAFAGALDDIKNDDGSIGAGVSDGSSNPYGGNNPSLTLGDGAITRTTSTISRTDTTTRRQSRTIDVYAVGDVETQEIRLTLQPSWEATDWLTLRGTVGGVATRISVDADATILVNGTRLSTVSGDDDGWVVTGLCGVDAVVSPLEWLSIFVGADLRLGSNKMDYSAGIADGTIELAKYTFRAGFGIGF
ncbi:MAG: hypothetical protein IJQ73_09025 [Kiritimatiellae bacterium]|nr:hypothetical protein [Kiritimatiellia bacterium]